MSKKRVYFIEPFMTGQMHVPFNAAMLKVMEEVYPNYLIELYAAADHMDALQRYTTLGHVIEKKTIPVIHVNHKFKWALKHLVECYVLIRILFRAKKHKPGLIYFSFLSPPAQWLLSFCMKYLFKSNKVLVQLHGLEILKKEKCVKRIDRIYAKLLSSAFRVHNNRKNYVVLEQTASKYLKTQGYLLKEEIIDIPHPFIFKPQVLPQQIHQPLVFAHLGVARLNKQSQLFFDLAAHFKESIQNGKAAFKIIGAVLPEMNTYINPWVHYNIGGEMISNEAYDQACRKIDFAVFCYSPDSYELTSSGAVIDAISYEKPILALTNKSFESLFAIPSTPPGRLFNNLEEIIQGIEKLLESSEGRQGYSEAFVDLRQHYSVKSVAEKLKKALFPLSTNYDGSN